MNDRIESATIRRYFHGDPPAVTSTKGVTGHTLGAAGAIEAALAALTLRHQSIPPTANLDRGFGGHNTVLILQRA